VPPEGDSEQPTGEEQEEHARSAVQTESASIGWRIGKGLLRAIFGRLTRGR
jgi:hypothetical protein